MVADPVIAFLQAMEAAGIRHVEPIADRLGNGELIKFQCEGDAPGQQNGAAWLWLDGWADGGFFHRGLGTSGCWCRPPSIEKPKRKRRTNAGDGGASPSTQQKE